jgi:hypothetical protein
MNQSSMKTINGVIKAIITLFIPICFVVFPLTLHAAQDDTVMVFDVKEPPDINGIGDDECWSYATWQNIDQVWINYGEYVEPSDYSGQYKIIWSSQKNLLYFLIEVTDDAAIGGFVNGETADVYNYDIAEVFIDENKSGGPHIYDNSSTGENAENAFAYHIYADIPIDGGITTEHWAGDMPVPHTDHIPSFALRKAGDVYTREFSLKVYDEYYDDAEPEASRVILGNDKIMGLSVAYCDNDDDDGQRDNFFGSVWVSEANYNNHWMNADDFGTVRLCSAASPDGIDENKYLQSMFIYPNPVVDCININSGRSGKCIEISDITGKIVSSFIPDKSISDQIPVSNLKRGIYYARIKAINNEVRICKFVKL